MRCAYNGPDGRHCAVGWLIADIPLSEGDNKESAQFLISVHRVIADALGIDRGSLSEHGDIEFIGDLQRCHDLAYDGGAYKRDNPLKMLNYLRQFASRHDLDASVLDGAEADLPTPLTPPTAPTEGDV
jgi:hypothetical protein